ncbi:MAG: hemerythrin domain-containing protein [Pseudomonadota bacterium]
MSTPSPSVIDIIRSDHFELLGYFHQYTSTSRVSAKKALADTLCDALALHTTLEEEIFYPVLRRLSPNDAIIQKSEPEHDEILRMIALLRETKPDDERHDILLHELVRDAMHHVADEETVLLPDAERLLGKERLAELGAAMQRRRLELVTPKPGKLARNAGTAAILVGVTGALMAALFVAKKPPQLSSQHH